jgi:hypothetical protein
MDRDSIRAAMLEAALRSDGVVHRCIANVIGTVALFDFPDNWPSLVPTLHMVLESSEPFIESAVRVLRSTLEALRASEPLISAMEPLSQLLLKLNPHSNPGFENLWCLTLANIHVRSPVFLPDFLKISLAQLFVTISSIFTSPGAISLKISAGKLLKQLIRSYPTAIQDRDLFHTRLSAAFDNLTDSRNPAFFVSLLCDIAISVMNSPFSVFFHHRGNLLHFCCESLSRQLDFCESEFAVFPESPIEYFVCDVEGSGDWASAAAPSSAFSSAQ